MSTLQQSIIIIISSSIVNIYLFVFSQKSSAQKISVQMRVWIK